MIVQTSTAEFQHMHLNETKKAKESIICVMLEQDMASSQFDSVFLPFMLSTPTVVKKCDAYGEVIAHSETVTEGIYESPQ